MAEKDRIALKAESDSLFPDNTTQDITPQRKRQFDQDMVDSNLNITTTEEQVIQGVSDFSTGLKVEGVDATLTLRFFRYDDVTDKLIATREIVTQLSSFSLGNQWTVSSAARSISFRDQTKEIDWEPVRSGLLDHSIPINRDTDAGIRQPQAPTYGDFIGLEFPGTLGVGTVPSGAGGLPWPIDLEVVGVEVVLGETLNSDDWIRYTVKDGVDITGDSIFSDARPVTSFPGFAEDDLLEWWLNPALRAEEGDFYFGIFEVLQGGRDGIARPALLKNTVEFPLLAWGKTKGRLLTINRIGIYNEYQKDSDASIQSTTSATFQLAHDFTTSELPVGEYIVRYGFSMAAADINTSFISQVSVAGVPVGEILEEEPADNDLAQRYERVMERSFSVSVAGTQLMELEYRSEVASREVQISGILMQVERKL